MNTSPRAAPKTTQRHHHFALPGTWEATDQSHAHDEGPQDPLAPPAGPSLTLLEVYPRLSLRYRNRLQFAARTLILFDIYQSDTFYHAKSHMSILRTSHAPGTPSGFEKAHSARHRSDTLVPFHPPQIARPTGALIYVGLIIRASFRRA